MTRSSIATIQEILRVMLDIKQKLDARRPYGGTFSTIKSIFGNLMQTAAVILDFTLSNTEMCAWLNNCLNQMTR